MTEIEDLRAIGFQIVTRDSRQRMQSWAGWIGIIAVVVVGVAAVAYAVGKWQGMGIACR